jgi:5-methylcytosine-specific restriction endonuclease McrA
MKLVRDPAPATPRKSMHKSRRARVLEAQDGVCAYPGCLVAEGLEIDHRIALELGGKEDWSNLWGLCAPHHAQKTKLDAKLIAKARRIRKKDAGEGRVKKKIVSGGFGKSQRKIKSAGFKKKCKPGEAK